MQKKLKCGVVLLLCTCLMFFCGGCGNKIDSYNEEFLENYEYLTNNIWSLSETNKDLLLAFIPSERNADGNLCGEMLSGIDGGVASYEVGEIDAVDTFTICTKAEWILTVDQENATVTCEFEDGTKMNWHAVISKEEINDAAYEDDTNSDASSDVATTEASGYDATNDYVFAYLGETVNDISVMEDAMSDYTNYGFYEGGIAIQFEQDASPYIFIVTPYDTASDTVYGTDEVAAVLITEAGVEINEEIQSGMSYSQIANAVKRGACSDLEYDDMNECYSAAVKYPFYEVLYSFESEDSNAMDVLIKKQ